MPRHFKVHELLDERELEDFRAFAREPGRTIDELHEWLLAKRYTLARSSVGTWKQKFDEELMAERMHGSGAMAKAFMNAAKESGGLAVPDASVLSVAQMIFESANSMAARGEVKPDDLSKMALALQRLTLAKHRVEKTRTEFEEREKKALAEAESVVAKGGSGEAVVDRVRQILGLDTKGAA